MKDLILNDARDFLQSKEWYSERGIPFRRGYLLVRLCAYVHVLTVPNDPAVRCSRIR